MSLTC